MPGLCNGYRSSGVSARPSGHVRRPAALNQTARRGVTGSVKQVGDLASNDWHLAGAAAGGRCLHVAGPAVARYSILPAASGTALVASAAAATESGEAKPDLRDGGVELIEAVSALVGGAILTPGPSSGRSEELQGDVVGIPERKPRAIIGVNDAAVGDAELIHASLPLLQLGSVRTGEGEMI